MSDRSDRSDYHRSDSDLTQSGLDEAGTIDAGEEATEKSPVIQSSRDRTFLLGFTNKQDFGQAQANYPEKMSDSVIPRDTNLIDFIQSIIRLKSTTAKLQQIPADHFVAAFPNPWESCSNINSTNNPSYNYSMDTKQREKMDLIRNRLVTHQNHSRENQSDDIVISETDESENPSLQSSQCALEDQSASTNNVVGPDSMGNFTIDSGIGSEKPESMEVANTSECVNENANRERRMESIGSTNNPQHNEILFNAPSPSDLKDRGKTFGTHTSRGFHVFGKGSSSEGNNPSFGRFGSKNLTAGDCGTRKSKFDTAFGGDSRTTTLKRPRHLMCSVTLDYGVRSVKCEEVLLSSVQAILKVLENEGNGCCGAIETWHDSVKKEGIAAIVSTVDLLENERGPRSCRNEVVAMVRSVLEKMLFSGKVDKAIIWEHHRLVILELCNASSVCTEVINYLISEVEKFIPVPMETTGESMKQSVMLMDKSYILFHALKIALQKYRSFTKPRVRVTADEEDGSNASENIPEIADLWKRHWRVNEDEADIFVTGVKRLTIPDDMEEVWTGVLVKLAAVSTKVWPLIKILAWQCLTRLNSSSTGSPGRDGYAT